MEVSDQVSGQLHAQVSLPLETSHPVPMELKVGWAPEPIWTLRNREKYLALAGN
jgi:hypothetical protein